jgi:hypothetical protein
MCFKWSSVVVRSGKLSNQFVPLPYQILVGKATGSLRQNHLSFPICEGHKNFLLSSENGTYSWAWRQNIMSF